MISKIVGNRNSGPDASPRSTRESERGGSKGDVRGEATAREAMKKSSYVGVIEKEEVRRDDPIEYFPTTLVKSTF